MDRIALGDARKTGDKMETPSRCPRCGRETPAGAHFCPGCGTDLSNPHARLATGLLPANQLLHRQYLVMRKLAQGGQSAVYLALDTLRNNQQRAIKEMSESNLSPSERDKAISDFMREANMLMSLNHPALAKVYETFVEGQKHFLVMEYVQGHNLEDELIETGRPLEWERVVNWGVLLCDVLQYLHTCQPPIIYRDLKPANVMLCADQSIKLVDFGIARWLHPSRARDTAQLGTDGYAPLEQYSARSEPRSDLYALGASLYHLLTGRVPEAAPMRIAGTSLTPIRTINPAVPVAVERVVHQALSLKASDRFEDAARLRGALEWAGNADTARRSRPTGGPAFVTGRIGATIGATIGAITSGGSARRTTAGATSVVSPRLHIWPLRLDAGLMDTNDTALLLLDIANRGGGALNGRIETNMHCLSAQPAVVDSTTTALQVRIDTSGLHPGPYTCHLAVRTNGGDQIIPVRFVVRQPGTVPETRHHHTGR